VELTTGIGVWGTKQRTLAEIAEEASKQIAKKFEALMRHYGIRANSSEKWQQLSLCLAQELGLMDITFERPRGAGAPPIWLAAEAELVRRMDETIGNKKMSAEEAARPQARPRARGNGDRACPPRRWRLMPLRCEVLHSRLQDPVAISQRQRASRVGPR
jgi:hypothetical protein